MGIFLSYCWGRSVLAGVADHIVRKADINEKRAKTTEENRLKGLIKKTDSMLDVQQNRFREKAKKAFERLRSNP